MNTQTPDNALRSSPAIAASSRLNVEKIDLRCYRVIAMYAVLVTDGTRTRRVTHTPFSSIQRGLIQVTLYIDYRGEPMKSLCVVNKRRRLDRAFPPLRFCTTKFYVQLCICEHKVLLLDLYKRIAMNKEPTHYFRNRRSGFLSILIKRIKFSSINM